MIAHDGRRRVVFWRLTLLNSVSPDCIRMLQYTLNVLRIKGVTLVISTTYRDVMISRRLRPIEVAQAVDCPCRGDVL